MFWNDDRDVLIMLIMLLGGEGDRGDYYAFFWGGGGLTLGCCKEWSVKG